MLRTPAALNDQPEKALAQLMTRGGDARIVIDPATGVNRYNSTPFPRDVLAFASSTANDLSEEAMAYLLGRFGASAGDLDDGADYALCLDELRAEIRDAYRLPAGTDVFFAPSGTDLEYVGLLAVAGRRPGGIANFLLGKDEVGSGCIHSARGRYFADETALGFPVRPAEPIAGLPPVELGDVAVRCPEGNARESAALAAEMEQSIAAALDRDQFPLVHIVHGSKTGLVLPHLDHVDGLRARFGDDVAFVVDACQARITDEAIRTYLENGIIVFVTGSKFMGGPPFSGFALLPDDLARNAAPLASGMATIFRRAEIPASWPGRDVCENSGNAGLALRLSASLFELRRFQAIGLDRVTRVVAAFTRATNDLARRLDVTRLASAPPEDSTEPAEHPIEMRTLVTLDLCHSVAGKQIRTLDFDDAAAIHHALMRHSIRLGQPVRCVRLADGGWGATLRLGLSMPQVTRLDRLDDLALERWLADAMDRIAAALGSLIGHIPAASTTAA